MVLHEDYVFIHFPATGGTYITKILEKYFDGKFIKDGGAEPGGVVHDTFESDYTTQNDFYSKKPEDKFIIGSIRNPYRYYVSVWGAMCRAYSLNQGRLVRKWNNNYPSYEHLLTDIDSIENFRKWTELILDGMSDFDNLHYSYEQIKNGVGICTQRYVLMYCRNNFEVLDGGELPNGIIDGFIRTENIIDDLIENLREAGMSISDEKYDRIKAEGKKNDRNYKHDTNDYYTDSLKDLVYEFEKPVIEKFNYKLSK